MTANHLTKMYFSKPEKYRAKIEEAMQGKSIVAPREDSNVDSRHAELRKEVPGISAYADRISKMNGDTAELDKDAANFNL